MVWVQHLHHCFLNILKTGWIGFAAFLELLEKLVNVPTCNRNPRFNLNRNWSDWFKYTLAAFFFSVIFHVWNLKICREDGERQMSWSVVMKTASDGQSLAHYSSLLFQTWTNCYSYQSQTMRLAWTSIQNFKELERISSEQDDIKL